MRVAGNRLNDAVQSRQQREGTRGVDCQVEPVATDIKTAVAIPAQGKSRRSVRLLVPSPGFLGRKPDRTGPDNTGEKQWYCASVTTESQICVTLSHWKGVT